MAAKRFLDDSNQDKDKPNDKRIRTTTSFASYVLNYYFFYDPILYTYRHIA
jgi:hypothetical protein